MRTYRVDTPTKVVTVVADDAEFDAGLLELVLDDGTTVAFFPPGEWKHVVSDPQ